jgi:uncharacterized protein
MSYVVKSNQFIIAKNVVYADNFMSRVIGLMFKNKMKNMDGLIITPCKSIHTFFMRFNIDVIFMDREYRVIKVIKNMKPWRISSFYWKAEHVLELEGSTINIEINKGDTLEVLCTK